MHPRILLIADTEEYYHLKGLGDAATSFRFIRYDGGFTREAV